MGRFADAIGVTARCVESESARYVVLQSARAMAQSASAAVVRGTRSRVASSRAAGRSDASVQCMAAQCWRLRDGVTLAFATKASIRQSTDRSAKGLVNPCASGALSQICVARSPAAVPAFNWLSARSRA